MAHTPHKAALEFLTSQQLLTLASHDEKDVWVANVYYAVADDGTLYFVSPEDNTHSRMILSNPNIAFTVAWFDPGDHKNRKAVQGRATCHPVRNPATLAKGIKLLYDSFPDLRDILTVEWIMKNAWKTKLWEVKPSYMKHWDDELYKDEEAKEFHID